MSHSSNSLPVTSSTSSSSRTALTADDLISYPLPAYLSPLIYRSRYPRSYSAPNDRISTKEIKHADNRSQRHHNGVRGPTVKENLTSHPTSPASSPTISKKSSRRFFTSTSSTSTLFTKAANTAYSSSASSYSYLDFPTAASADTTFNNGSAYSTKSSSPHTPYKNNKKSKSCSRSCFSAFDFSYLNLYTTASGTCGSNSSSGGGGGGGNGMGPSINGRRAVLGTPVSMMGACTVM